MIAGGCAFLGLRLSLHPTNGEAQDTRHARHSRRSGRMVGMRCWRVVLFLEVAPRGNHNRSFGVDTNPLV